MKAGAAACPSRAIADIPSVPLEKPYKQRDERSIRSQTRTSVSADGDAIHESGEKAKRAFNPQVNKIQSHSFK